MSIYPKITFGIIVLNGEPFTKYCLRSIYPYAHEIIVVEGGSEGARQVTSLDGHSLDGTLETLFRFKQEEDPQNKVQIVVKNGHWPQKDEFGRDRTPQSRAYAERATGDYLWQVDIDEFYFPRDIEIICEMLRNDPSITAVSFKTKTFWGRPEYLVDGWPLRRGLDIYHRLFMWGKGYKYATHQPPTILNESGRDLRKLNWVKAEELAKRNIFMYHYSLLFPSQVEQKTRLYQEEKPEECANIVNWANENYFHLKNPYRVHNLYREPSWLQRYSGDHPPEVKRMMNDIVTSIIEVNLRESLDIEQLLSRGWYRAGIIWLIFLERVKKYVKQVKYLIRLLRDKFFNY